jgi:hypothetical protein
MLARATTRMILAAQSAYASGRTGVAFAGQTIMITLGLPVVGIQGQLELGSRILIDLERLHHFDSYLADASS